MKNLMYLFLKKLWNLGFDQMEETSQIPKSKTARGKRFVFKSVSNNDEPFIRGRFGRVNDSSWLLTDEATRRSALRLISWKKQKR